MQLSLVEQLMGVAFIVGLIGMLLLYHAIFDRRKKTRPAAAPPAAPIAAASAAPDPRPASR